MKQFLLFVLGAILLSGCNNEGSQKETAAPQPAGPPPQAIPNTREARLLIQDYWVFEYYIVEGNRELSLGNRGKWYKFSPDGTFLAGHWEDFTTTGTWSLHYGVPGGYPLVRLDAENPELTAEYQLQGISAEEDYMSWVGTARHGQKGWAAKVMRLLTAPTKKQFGVE